MNDYLISMYIDNELDLDEKVEFVETVHASTTFTQETIELLEQEKSLRQSPVQVEKFLNLPVRPGFSWTTLLKSWWRPTAGLAMAAMLAVFLVFTLPQQGQVPESEDHRFVIYSPQENQLNIIGTFTRWQPVPMEKIGTTGYWTLTLKVPKGEHKYSFVIENGAQMPDPTIVTRENDDFGGENSVIIIGGENAPVS